jgi:hypothetical protein
MDTKIDGKFSFVDNANIGKSNWEEFCNSGLLWFVNRMLAVFGWAIVVTPNEDGSIVEVYPSRLKFDGYEADIEADSSKFLCNNIIKEPGKFMIEEAD